MIFLGILSACAIKGLDPASIEILTQEAHLFKGPDFECSGKVIPITFINDDYCDCLDGSDEPGISNLRLEQVLVRMGYRAKQKLISQANKNIAKEVEDLEASLELLKKDEEIARLKKEAAEKSEEEFKSLDEQRIREGCPSKFEELRNKYSIMRTAKYNMEIKFNEVYQDLIKLKDNTDENIVSTLVNRVESLGSFLTEMSEVEEAEASLASLKIPIDENPCLMPSKPIWMCAIHSFNLLKAKVLEFTFSKPKAPNAQESRDEYNDITTKRSDTERQLEELKKRAGIDFGTEMEWYALYEKCFEFDTIEYTYELCLFGNARQKSKSGSSEVDLGKFSRWGPRNGERKGYGTMMFENGLGCWNGPQRSVQVTFECGEITEITNVAEPNTCEYIMNVKTPAVCPNLSL